MITTSRAAPKGQTPSVSSNVVTHVDLNDDTVEGFRHAKLPVFSVQYHPKASPGPHDAAYLVDALLVGVPLTVSAFRRNRDDEEPAPFWLFHDEMDWRRSQQFVEAERLPPYDPAIHSRPIRGPLSSALMSLFSVPGVVLWSLVIAPLLAPLLMLRRRSD